MGVFRDFIPAGEDTGAQGSGFVDFVPTPEVKEVVVEETAEVPTEETPEVKEVVRGRKTRV